MASDKINSETTIDKTEQEITWSSKQRVRSDSDRRSGADRRQMTGRAITVPDRRSGTDRRKVRLTITGRALGAKQK